MDTTALMLSLLFGTAGMGYVMYGKKAGVLIPVAAGVLLMVCPYFISNALAMTVVCSLIAAVPFVLRGG